MAELLKLYKDNARKASHYTFKLVFIFFYVNSSSDSWKCLLLGSADLLSILDCGKIFFKHFSPFSINWGHTIWRKIEEAVETCVCLWY